MVNEDEKIKTLTEDISLLESYIQDLFSFTHLPLCLINPNRTALEVNSAFIRMNGYDEHDVAGEDVSFFDVTEIKEKEIEAKRSKKELEEKMEEINRLKKELKGSKEV